MAKGFFISKLVALVAIFFAIAAVATIIALAVVYSNEKSNNKVENGGTTSTTITIAPTTRATGTTSTATTTPTTRATGTTTTTTATSTVKPASTTPASNEIWDQYRLPKNLVPDHYDIDLRPVLIQNAQGLYVFHGESKAHFTCNVATPHVIIHSNKLNYTEDPVLTDEAGGKININKHFFVEKTQFLVLQLNEHLSPGSKYTLHTKFVGELADDLAGFYRSEYVEDGVNKIIATTQMQAPDARKAFPCFDEPEWKATFNITLRHKPDYVALSNMDIIDVTTKVIDGETWNVTKYSESPKMLHIWWPYSFLSLVMLGTKGLKSGAVRKQLR
ncbi:hypothetical protein GDO81_009523 [Engystomops pustulosus]|uniref:Aminopeptidase N-like N-terminal domain-containing protein n=1 Tax=Engystomops pustulosus TaxID=76066 RepID=A0AAV7BRJ3_ENGPU|nr:hypothetical protein GDO81_009523 [Engystomops pustulosus]